MNPVHEPTHTATHESSAVMATIQKSTKAVLRHLGLTSNGADLPVMLARLAMKTWRVVLSPVVSVHPSSVVSALPSLVVPSLVVLAVLPPLAVLPVMATAILCVWPTHTHTFSAALEVAVATTAPPEAVETATAALWTLCLLCHSYGGRL